MGEAVFNHPAKLMCLKGKAHAILSGLILVSLVLSQLLSLYVQIPRCVSKTLCLKNVFFFFPKHHIKNQCFRGKSHFVFCTQMIYIVLSFCITYQKVYTFSNFLQFYTMNYTFFASLSVLVCF